MNHRQADHPGDRNPNSESGRWEEAERRGGGGRHVAGRYGPAVRVREIASLGGRAGDKGFGYGTPLRVTLGLEEMRSHAEPATDAGRAPGSRRAVVVRTVGAGGFGQDPLAGGTPPVVLAYETFNNLPCHVRTLD